jgi:DNA-binding NarL/FixJ family response regulator
MRILIADDMPKVRTALQLLLREQAALEVVGAIARSADLMISVQILHPDLILLDWELAGESTHAILSELRRLEAVPSIVALSSQPEAREAALAAGVDAFISKSDPPEHLLSTLLTMAH